MDDVSATFLRWLTIADPISISKSILTTLLLMLIASEEWSVVGVDNQRFLRELDLVCANSGRFHLTSKRVSIIINVVSLSCDDMENRLSVSARNPVFRKMEIPHNTGTMNSTTLSLSSRTLALHPTPFFHVPYRFLHHVAAPPRQSSSIVRTGRRVSPLCPSQPPLAGFPDPHHRKRARHPSTNNGRRLTRRSCDVV